MGFFLSALAGEGCVLSLEHLHVPGKPFGATGHVLEVHGDAFDDLL